MRIVTESKLICLFSANFTVCTEHCVLTAPLYLFIESKFGILFVIQPLVKWYVLSRQGQADQEKVKEY